MGKFVSDVIEIGSFGLIDDPLGIEAGQEATSQAAGVQERASQAGIEESRRQFDITEARLQEAEEFQREQLQPFQEAGVGALEQQQALIGLKGPEAQEAAFATLKESPGQRFLRERQQKALLRSASAIGGLGGGNIRTALQEQAVGFAQQDIANQFGRLGQIAGQGQAAGRTIGAGATGTATSLGQFGQANIADINRARQAAAEARASGILGRQQVEAQTTGQILNLGGQFAGAAFGAA